MLPSSNILSMSAVATDGAVGRLKNESSPDKLILTVLIQINTETAVPIRKSHD
jgi:hypothetical protein